MYYCTMKSSNGHQLLDKNTGLNHKLYIRLVQTKVKVEVMGKWGLVAGIDEDSN